MALTEDQLLRAWNELVKHSPKATRIGQTCRVLLPDTDLRSYKTSLNTPVVSDKSCATAQFIVVRLTNGDLAWKPQ